MHIMKSGRISCRLLLDYSEVRINTYRPYRLPELPELAHPS